MANESHIQKRKIAIAEKVIREQDQYSAAPSVHAAIGGLHVEFICKGAKAKPASDFLKGYFSAFQNEEIATNKVVMTFEMLVPGSEDFDCQNPIWNDPDESILDVRLSDGSNWQLLRDVLGTAVAPDRTLCMMPCPAVGVTDGIDNLVASYLPGQLLANGVVPLHAATVEKDGGVYIFFGQSGAGKSTLAHFCADSLGLKMLGGDQIYVKITSDGLFAHPCSTTVWDYPRSHPKLLIEPRPILGFVHLIQKGDWYFQSLTRIDAMRLFMKEIFCPKGVGTSEMFLKNTEKIFKSYHKNWVQMSYPKGQNFWPELAKQL